jgi:hypothetical protein
VPPLYDLQKIILMQGLWEDITPYLQREHPWVFGKYLETPTDRADGNWYVAFVFRNKKRTAFGIKEFVDKDLHHYDYRKMADRVLKEENFRSELLSDDPDLPKIWKKH